MLLYPGWWCAVHGYSRRVAVLLLQEAYSSQHHAGIRHEYALIPYMQQLWERVLSPFTSGLAILFMSGFIWFSILLSTHLVSTQRRRFYTSICIITPHLEATVASGYCHTIRVSRMKLPSFSSQWVTAKFQVHPLRARFRRLLPRTIPTSIRF